jgi:hypothetical protein
MLIVCLQLTCIPADDKLVSIGLPLSSSVVPFLKASAYATDSFRLDSECQTPPHLARSPAAIQAPALHGIRVQMAGWRCTAGILTSSCCARWHRQESRFS